MARKKKGGGDAGEGANWMDTYGDMVTLLLAFFVLLFSFSTIDAEKWEALVGSLTGTGTSIIQTLDMQTVVESPITLEVNTQLTDDPYDPDNPYPEEEPGNAEQDLENFWALVNQLQNFIDENDLDADLYPEQETLTVTLRVKDNVFFDSGDATVKESSFELLDNLKRLFSTNIKTISLITIEGHTDTDPINNAEFEDNLALSSQRAGNVVRYLQRDSNISGEKIIATGMSEYHPIEPNDTPEGKAANRRVDFVIQSYVSGANN